MDNQTSTLVSTPRAPIDCACVIHGDAYVWAYVERLYNMLNRHISHGIRLHVYTEAERPVPSHMIKHALVDWKISGPKRSWWYKLQLFNTAAHAGPLLYFDLDTVIIKNIDWICDLPSKWFWTVQDFRYLWRPSSQSINSSIMWWDTQLFEKVWHDFQQQNLQKIIKQYRGDQDYLNQVLQNSQIRFLDSQRIKSWRWQCQDVGIYVNGRSRNTDIKTVIAPETDVLVFHGNPKPHELGEVKFIQDHWR
jgi:hypothetical protein